MTRLLFAPPRRRRRFGHLEESPQPELVVVRFVRDVLLDLRDGQEVRGLVEHGLLDQTKSISGQHGLLR
jgi:hypothetical protein